MVVFIAYMLIPAKIKKKKEGKHALAEDDAETDEVDISDYVSGAEDKDSISQESENDSVDISNESDSE